MWSSLSTDGAAKVSFEACDHISCSVSWLHSKETLNILFIKKFSCHGHCGRFHYVVVRDFPPCEQARGMGGMLPRLVSIAVCQEGSQQSDSGLLSGMCSEIYPVSKLLVIEKGAWVVALGCKSKASTSDLVIVVLGILGTAPWLHFERPA